MAISDKGLIATYLGCWGICALGVIAFWSLVALALAKFVFDWTPFG